MAWYYLVVFVTGLLMADLDELTLIHVGSQSMVAIDVINLTALAMGGAVVASGGLRRLTRPGRAYALFLAWTLWSVAYGATRFGGSAFGEFRYVTSLFYFFVPLALADLRRTDETIEGGTIMLQTLGVAVAAAALMFVIELASGGRVFVTVRNRAVFSGFTDFRGLRYLDTYQTFALMLGAGALLLRRGTDISRRWGDLVLAGALIVIALWTRNRAAIVAVGGALVALGIAERRFRGVLGTGVAAVLALGIVALLSEGMWAQLRESFGGVISPTHDATGRWRLLIQLAAIEQGLRTPWFGQGYGGYYLFDIPGMQPILAPPHNQYIELFMKGGLLSLILCVAALAWYGRAFWHARGAVMLHPRERLAMRLLVLALIAQIPYGMAYDFPPMLGLLIGFGEVVLQRQRERTRIESRHRMSPAASLSPVAS